MKSPNSQNAALVAHSDGLRIGGHQWVEANDLVKWPHCAVCGIIRRHDDKNNPCKGAAKLSLRSYYTEGSAPLPESGTNNAAGPDSAVMGSSSVLPTEAGTCARNEIAPPVSAPAAPTGETPRTDALRNLLQTAQTLADAYRDQRDEARRELAEIRDALAGTDYASLPSDFPTVRMAHTIRADHDKKTVEDRLLTITAVSTTQPRLTVGTPEWREWLDVQVDANFIIGYTGTRDDLQAVAEKAQRIADIAAKHTTGKSTASATQERTDG